MDEWLGFFNLSDAAGALAKRRSGRAEAESAGVAAAPTPTFTDEPMPTDNKELTQALTEACQGLHSRLFRIFNRSISRI